MHRAESRQRGRGLPLALRRIRENEAGMSQDWAAAGVVIGLTAVIVAVTAEVPRVLVVRRTAHSLLSTERWEETENPALAGLPGMADLLPFGPFAPDRHRTLDSGLRIWVEEQTGFTLSYVEQLYTFGDRHRDPREQAGGPRVITVGYIALVREAPLSGSGDAVWSHWYDFLPWEDWRHGPPPLITRAIRPALHRWAEAAGEASLKNSRLERVSLAFGDGSDSGPWDGERALERYELLYESGLVPEAIRDRMALSGGSGLDPGAVMALHTADPAFGRPMALDNRRILATALGRLRGKLKYRPLVFELLPPTFTLSHLQRLVEALSGTRLHKQNFRRLLINDGLVEPTGRIDSQTGGRPAELYRFRREILRERQTSGVGLPPSRK